MIFPEIALPNFEIAELLAQAGEDAKPPLNKAYRRASRKAMLWVDEASHLHQAGRPLTELPGVGPYLEKIIRRWIESPPLVPSPPRYPEQFSYENTSAFYFGKEAVLGGASQRGLADAHTLE